MPNLEQLLGARDLADKITKQNKFIAMSAATKRIEDLGKADNVDELTSDERISIAEYVTDEVSRNYAEMIGIAVNPGFYSNPIMKNLLTDHLGLNRAKLVDSIARDVTDASAVIGKLNEGLNERLGNLRLAEISEADIPKLSNDLVRELKSRGITVSRGELNSVDAIRDNYALLEGLTMSYDPAKEAMQKRYA